MFEGQIDDGPDGKKLYGVHSATVVDTDDPEEKSRVKIDLNNREDPEQLWARVARLMAGDGFGTHFQPDTGAEVLVTFENGDVDGQPFVVGSLHNEDEDLIATMRDDWGNMNDALDLAKLIMSLMSSSKQSPQPTEVLEAVRDWADYVPGVESDSDSITTETGSELEFTNMYLAPGPGAAADMIDSLGEKVAEGERMAESFESHSVDAEFTISNISHEAPKKEGDVLTVEAEITNEGDDEAEQSVGLEVLDEEVDEKDVELDSGESEEITFEGIFDPDESKRGETTIKDGFGTSPVVGDDFEPQPEVNPGAIGPEVYTAEYAVFTEDDSEAGSFEVQVVDDDDDDDDSKTSDDIKGASKYLSGAAAEDALADEIGGAGNEAVAESMSRFVDTTEISTLSGTAGGLDDWVADPGEEFSEGIGDITGASSLTDVPGITPGDTPNLSSISLDTQSDRGLSIDDLTKLISLSDPLGNSVSLDRTGVDIYTKTPGGEDALELISSATSPMDALKEVGGGSVNITAHGTPGKVGFPPLQGSINLTATDATDGDSPGMEGGSINLSAASAQALKAGNIELSTVSEGTLDGGSIDLTAAGNASVDGGEINLTAAKPSTTNGGNINMTAGYPVRTAGGEIELKANTMRITVDNITIDATEEINLDATDINLNAQDNISLSANTAVDIEAARTTVEADNQATLKGNNTTVRARNGAKVEGSTTDVEGETTTVSGTQTTVEGDTQMNVKGKQLGVKGTNTKLEGSGSMQVEGATVSVKADALVNVEGGLIMLN